VSNEKPSNPIGAGIADEAAVDAFVHEPPDRRSENQETQKDETKQPEMAARQEGHSEEKSRVDQENRRGERKIVNVRVTGHCGRGGSHG